MIHNDLAILFRVSQGAVMWSFGKKSSKALAVSQRMCRLINDSFSTSQLLAEQMAAHGRCESRSLRNLPCIIFLTSEADAPNCYAMGVTLDLSLQGISLVTHERLEPVSYIVVAGSAQYRVYLMGNCLYSRSLELSAYASGFALTEVLEPHSYPAVIRAVSLLETGEDVGLDEIPTQSKEIQPAWS